MSDDVTLDVTGGVATLTLDNPEKMNALSPGIVAGVERALGEIDEHDDARCVVVEGAGDAFCAGGDIGGMSDREDVSGHERAQGVTESATSVAGGLYDCDLPTVAKVDGYCVGAGMGVALSCDVVLASEDATFSLAFRNVGLSLDYGTSYFVTQAVGPYKAKELALTAEMLSGEEAEEMGLVNHAYAPGEFDAKADAFVETVASGPTVALEYSLRNIDRAARRTVEEAIEAESQAQSFATQTRDHEEGVAAFAEDREPEFEGR
jgi:2-(1,2-epoxy-1,2-dihydrophenyl)acetyl-CoA isomerase